ncbi:phosphocholine-specific phospholipase C [Coralloluteibacterium stylophorae]|uniref:phospholipase C n=1 Tax=Coralloluteibacterium stylophorae TaxID=1776034 RepID=A0A8J7VQV6_9GAMM|nr:phospholipase C, phosphocholine-specific [Coralloluteibacterium stylophorae]MBS7456935.1 phospholipase C, phosphocholine-specific [Coralloluteibacterium stylophorae]
MTATDRRRFLKLAGSAGLAGAALASLPPSVRNALAVEPARVTGTLADIGHVVILMQENRSFDHYFGTLRGVRGFGDPRPWRLPGGRAVWAQRDADGREVLPFRLDTVRTGAAHMHDLDHSWKGAHADWKHHDAWVARKTALTMGHFTREDIPFYHALADAFTVCDAYHCSVFGPTNPNRLFLFSGTSGLHAGARGEHAVTNADDGNWTADSRRDRPDFEPLRWTTYAERLQAAGIDWKVYQEYDNYGDNTLQSFAAFRGLADAAPLHARGRAYVAGTDAEQARTTRGEPLVAALRADVERGRLPQVSWIVAPYAMCEHPDAPPGYGEAFSARVLEALTADPEVWARTVFLINYDENDGFFDHVPPPLPAIAPAFGASSVPTDGEDWQGTPMGLGPRVPMLVVSPWSRGGWVNSQVFDHTSVIRLLERRFGVHEPNIGAWRRAVAGDLTSTLDFARGDRRRPPPLPGDGAAIARTDGSRALPMPQLPAQAAMPVQEAGQRPARPLPYDLDVQAHAAGTALELAFVNRGTAGAVFIVRSDDAAQGPWHYTVGAGDVLRAHWPRHGAALAVYGPNGFLREFAGAGDAAPEVAWAFDAAAGLLRLTLRNPATRACRLSLEDGYRGAGPLAVTLDPAGERHLDIDIAAHAHWYDLTLRSRQDPGWRRRLAGHVETGAPSLSDPAIGAAPPA